MASPESHCQPRQRPVRHGRGCAYDLNKEDECNCYLSFYGDTVSDLPAVFQPATAKGATDMHCELDEYDQAALEKFVGQKRSSEAHWKAQTSDSKELYGLLEQGEIRVLELFPSQSDAPMQAKLHTVSIDFSYPTGGMGNPPGTKEASGLTYTRSTNHAVSIATGKPVWYTALSYVWGPPIFDQTIQLDDQTMRITISLASALRRFRSAEHSIFLWIDQLCINQSDIREKEQQIPLMGTIYSHATNTVIWLGEGDGEEPEVAFEAMRHIHGKLQQIDVEVKPEDFERFEFPPVDHPSWLAIWRLLERPWVTRLWTIQEAYLSRDLFVQCGVAVTDWNTLTTWTLYLETSGLLSWLAARNSSDSRSLGLATLRQPTRSGGEIFNAIEEERGHHMTVVHKAYLLAMLVSTRYANATEPKDKIYGVLGMAESQIKPDYSPIKTARDVYLDACVTALPGQVYELLSSVDHEQPLAPSWVPDWSTPRVTEALGYFTKAWTVYSAGGQPANGRDKSSPMANSHLLSADKKRLTLSGIMFDKVIGLGDVNETLSLDIEDPPRGNRGWVSYTDLVKSTCSASDYPSPNMTIYEAFWQTLVAGRDGSGTAAPTQGHSEVFSVILDATTGQKPSLPGQTYSPRREKGYFTLNSLRSRKPAKTLDDLRTAMRSALTMRRFAITQKSYFALVPRGTKEGDEIVVFEKACVPFVVRRAEMQGEESKGYQLLGEAYMHGIMRGEAVEMPGVEFEDVTLV